MTICNCGPRQTFEDSQMSALDLKTGDVFQYSAGSNLYLMLERGSIDLTRMAICGIDWRESDDVTVVGRVAIVNGKGEIMKKL